MVGPDVEVQVGPVPSVQVLVEEYGEDPVVVEIGAPSQTVEVVIPGPPGPPGPQGDPGPPGSGGVAGGVYVHEQGVPSARWEINHGLGKRPNWTVTDSSGIEYEGEYHHPSLYISILEFDVPFGGIATGN